jgi:hypothetical protein
MLKVPRLQEQTVQIVCITLYNGSIGPFLDANTSGVV